MANSKLTQNLTIRSIERLTSKFGAAATLGTAAFTIPAGTTRIYIVPSAACHWHPTGTPTSSFGHAVAADKPFVLEHKDMRTAKIIGDAGAITATCIYCK